MKETLEREVKLSVGSDFTLPPLQTEPTPRHLRAIYYDTEDQRLARHGVTLRRRLEDGRDLWQLKLPAGRRSARARAPGGGPADPRRASRGCVTAYVRGAELRPLAELHTLRRALRVTVDGKPSAEVVHDTVDVHDGDRIVRSFAEVEIEQIADGSEQHLARLERELRAAGAKSSDGRPKVFQALDLPARRQAKVKRRAPAIEQLRAYLQRQVDSLLEHDPATRRGEIRRACTGCASRRAACAARSRRAGEPARPGLGARDARRAEMARRRTRRGARRRRLRRLRRAPCRRARRDRRGGRRRSRAR